MAAGVDYSQAQWIAKIYATMNEKELAFAWLERGFGAGALGVFYKDDPAWDKLRNEPRLARLIQRMGIPQS